jgi:hypothetical protein
MPSVQKGGVGEEPWYKSRRIWSAVLSGVLAIVIQLGASEVIDMSLANNLASVIAVIGGSFGLNSWLKPKK